jgi:hypothetical protein
VIDDLEVVEEQEALAEVELVEEEIVEAGEVKASKVRKKRKRPRAGEERPRRVSTRGLDTVNIGLGFHYARMVVILFGLLGMIVLLFAAAAAGARAAGAAKAGRPADPDVAGLVIVVVLALCVTIALNFVAPLLGLVGSILCSFAPAQSGAKGFIIASLVLDLLSLPVAIVLQFVNLIPAFKGIAVLGAIPAFLMGFIAWAMFMLFLKQLCSYLSEDAMANEAMAIMMRGLLILCVAPVLVIGLVVVVGVFMCCGLIPTGLLLFYSVYYFFEFLRRQLDLIGSMRQVILSRF